MFTPGGAEESVVYERVSSVITALAPHHHPGMGSLTDLTPYLLLNVEDTMHNSRKIG